MPFQKSEVERTLGKWYERQLKSPLRRKTEGTVFGIQPEVSSQEAVDVFLELEPIVGFEIKGSKMIKSGGYESCDEFVKHLLPQIEARYAKQFPAVRTSSTKTSRGVTAHANQ
jgi:hypothetical protein